MDVAEFKGNVALVKTDVFWDTEAEAVFKKGWRENLDEWNKVGSDYPYHYLGQRQDDAQDRPGLRRGGAGASRPKEVTSARSPRTLGASPHHPGRRAVS